MSQPELVYLHIPKTAGTSARTAFYQHYGKDAVFWYGINCPGNIKTYPSEQVDGFPVVGGHRPLSFYPRSSRPLYCAVLRDPLERAFSLFHFHTRRDLGETDEQRARREKTRLVRLSNGFDPDSMLNSIRQCRSFRREITNMQCTYLSRRFKSFRAVKWRLRRHDFVLGTVDNFDAFHGRLGELLGWHAEPARVVNHAREDYMSELSRDAALVQEITRLNKEDLKLYDYINATHGGLMVNVRDIEARTRSIARALERSASSQGGAAAAPAATEAC